MSSCCTLNTAIEDEARAADKPRMDEVITVEIMYARLSAAISRVEQRLEELLERRTGDQEAAGLPPEPISLDLEVPGFATEVQTLDLDSPRLPTSVSSGGSGITGGVESPKSGSSGGSHVNRFFKRSQGSKSGSSLGSDAAESNPVASDLERASPFERRRERASPFERRSVNLSQWHGLGIAALVAANLVWLGLEVQNNTVLRRENGSAADRRDFAFTVLRISFCVAYFLDLLYRLFKQRRWFFQGEDGKENWFEFGVLVLEVISIFPAYAMLRQVSILRSYRLIRLLRVLRVCRVWRTFFRDCDILVQSLLKSCVSHFWILVALLCTTLSYLVGMIMTQGAADHCLRGNSSLVCDEFGTLERSMLTLYESMLGGRLWAVVLESLKDIPHGYSIIFLVFMSFCRISIMSIALGIVFKRLADSFELEQSIVERDASDQFATEIKEMTRDIYWDESGVVTKEDLEDILEKPHVAAALRSWNFDTYNVLELLQHFNAEDEISFQEFIHACSCMKGKVKAFDILKVGMQCKSIQNQLAAFRSMVEQTLSERVGRSRSQTGGKKKYVASETKQLGALRGGLISRTDDALRNFLLARSQGIHVLRPPYGYAEEIGVIRHRQTGIKVSCPPLQVANPTDDQDVILLYHYAPAEAYQRITASSSPTHLRASYAERAHFGDGVYATQFAPHHFGSKDAILLNNYTNKTIPSEQEVQIAPWRGKGVVDYCIPIVVPRAAAVNIRLQKTKEMDRPGYTARHNQPLRSGRDVWVIVIADAAGQVQSASEHSETTYIRLNDKHWTVRLHSVEVLSGVAATSVDQRATDAIIESLQDVDPHVCVAAVWAVASAKALTLPRAQELIEKVLEFNDHPLVKDAVSDAQQFLISDVFEDARQSPASFSEAQQSLTRQVAQSQNSTPSGKTKL